MGSLYFRMVGQTIMSVPPSEGWRYFAASRFKRDRKGVISNSPGNGKRKTITRFIHPAFTFFLTLEYQKSKMEMYKSTLVCYQGRRCALVNFILLELKNEYQSKTNNNPCGSVG